MSGIAKRRLGRTGLQVTELGMGGFGYTGDSGLTRAQGEAILDRAFEAGINYFDTSPAYGAGESEELLGRALSRHGSKGVFVSTKVGYLDRTIGRAAGNDGYRNEGVLMRAILHSLWRLRLERVDALLVHEPDWGQWGFNLRTGEATVMRVLEKLKSEGVTGAIGIGGWDCELMADLIETGRFDVALVAGGVTLVKQPIRKRVLAAAKKHDVGIVLGGAFGQGAQIVKDRVAAQAMIDSPSRVGQVEHGKKLLKLYDLSDETGIDLPELLVRYVVGMEEIHTHVAGAGRMEHLEGNLAAVKKGPLSAGIVERIEEIGGMFQ